MGFNFWHPVNYIKNIKKSRGNELLSGIGMRIEEWNTLFHR